MWFWGHLWINEICAEWSSLVCECCTFYLICANIYEKVGRIFSIFQQKTFFHGNLIQKLKINTHRIQSLSFSFKTLVFIQSKWCVCVVNEKKKIPTQTLQSDLNESRAKITSAKKTFNIIELFRIERRRMRIMCVKWAYNICN